MPDLQVAVPGRPWRRCCTAIAPGVEQYAADDLQASPLMAQYQAVPVGGGAGAREDAKALQG